MKKIVFLMTLFAIINIFSLEFIDKIVAKVGREIILESELLKRKQQMEAAGYLTPEITDYDILNDMVESKLIIQKAKQEDFQIDKNDVRQIAQQEIEGLRKNFKSEDVFVSELKKETGLSVSELKDFYVEMITEQKLRDQIINSKIKNKSHITEVEIDEFYQEKKEELPKRPAMDEIGMILKNIKASKSTKKNALKNINRVRDKALAGEEFSELANNYSECPSGKKGGDLGFFGKGMMVEAFEETAFSLKPGEISEVVETTFGFHIIKLLEINKDSEEIRASHILIKIEPTEEDIKASVTLMEGVLDKLRKGENFNLIAKTYSDDDSTAANGGIIGEFMQDQYPEMFKEELAEISYGEYTDIFREENVLYIFTKTRFIPERYYFYDEVFDKLRQMLISQKEQDLYENWVTELKKEAYVEILIDE